MPAVLPLQVRLTDAERFPDWRTCEARREELVQFIQWHRDQFWCHFDATNEQMFHGGLFWPWNAPEAYWASRNQMEWAERAADQWSFLTQATYPANSQWTRWEALRTTLRYLGKERYLAGDLPPVAPDWWLRRPR